MPNEVAALIAVGVDSGGYGISPYGSISSLYAISSVAHYKRVIKGSARDPSALVGMTGTYDWDNKW